MLNTENNPSVTVLFPISNQSVNIQQSLNSVLSQTYKRLKVLIIDGSGKTEVKGYLKSILHKDKRLKYFPKEEMTAAQVFQETLTCLRLCPSREPNGGGYIQWLIPGDLLSNNKIEIMVNAYLNNKDKNIAVISSHVQIFNKDNSTSVIKMINTDKPLMIPGSSMYKNLLSGFKIPSISSILIHEDIIKNSKAIDEFTLFIELMSNGNLLYLPIPLTFIKPTRNMTIQEGIQNSLQWAQLIQNIKKNPNFPYKIYKHDMKNAIIAWINQFMQFRKFTLDQNIYFEEICDLQNKMLDFSIDLKNWTQKKKCACCGNEIEYYLPIPEYYSDMTKKYGTKAGQAEMVSKYEYSCPRCYSADRERAYALWMKRELDPNIKDFKILEIAPSKCLKTFIKNNFPLAIHKTGDLFMEDVDYKLDIMNMNQIETNSIDFFICSHVLEHVYDDIKAMRELKRILKPTGCGILVVPINLLIEDIDEDPDCTDVAERWRRFGQDDHVRAYSKVGFLKRMEKVGFNVKQFDKNYFGNEIMAENGMIDTSVVYIVSP